MTSFLLLRPLWLIAIIPLFIAAWFMRKQQQNKGWNSVLAPENRSIFIKRIKQ